jgi:hypothetical protein
MAKGQMRSNTEKKKPKQDKNKKKGEATSLFKPASSYGQPIRQEALVSSPNGANDGGAIED